jgi:Na+/phosphate symporter
MVFVRKAGQEKRDREHMKSLRQQLNAYQTNLQRAETKIAELEKQLAAAMRDRENQNLTQTPAERVYLDIIKNHGRDPHGRRYCVETLAWAEEIHTISPHALEVVGKVISVPSETLINSKFAQTRRVMSEALQDSERMHELIDLWNQSGARTASERTVVLAVDAVAFRPHEMTGGMVRT